MDTDAIRNILAGGGSELEFLKENLDQLRGFLALVETVDKLPDMDRRVSEDGVSLYHAVSKEKEMAVLERTVANFFQEPVKRAGEPLPDDLSDSPTVNSLGGVKPDQTLFLNRLGNFEFFAALFPWQHKVDVITVHLGLYNPMILDEDLGKIRTLVTETITQRVSEEVDGGLKGQVQGISLPSFLQMSEMEGSTCSLRIRSGDRVGMLHLLNGNLIDAEAGELKHKEAAYEIVAWDSPSIEILKAVGRTKNEIQVPLMHLLMDSLRIKDQKEYEKDAPAKKVGRKPAPKKPAPKKKASQVQSRGKTPPVVKAPPAQASDSAVSKQPVKPKPADTATKPKARKSLRPQPSASKSPDAGDAIRVDADMQPLRETPAPGAPQPEDAETDDAIEEALIQQTEPDLPKRPKPKEKKASPASRKTFPVAVIAVVALLVLGGGGYFVFDTMVSGRVSDYERLMQKFDRLSGFEAREKLLVDFIDTHEPGEETAKAEARLAELWRQNEEENYQETIDAVNKLPVDRAFEKNAKALYNAFLEKYPHSQYRREIERALTEISGLSEDVIFSDLKKFGAKEYAAKIRAYEDYLSRYPQGKYVEPVKKMFSETLGDAYIDFKKDIAVCERASDWDACLDLCDDYWTAYSKYIDMSEIERIRTRMRMQKEFVDLQSQTAGMDSRSAKDLYTAYVQKYPDSPHNQEIQEILQRVEQNAAAGQQWLTLKKYVQRADAGLQSKIDRLERFLSHSSGSPYVNEARTMLDELEAEAEAEFRAQQQAVSRREAEEKARQEAEERYARLMARQAEKAHIEKQKQQVLASLNQAGGRYRPSGDSAVVDNNTGLMWGLLDSYREIGNCMDHRAAKRYVKELRYNGYDDWRLPTSAELASIYKNPPYFPATGAEWYWTSEIFAKGYSYVVNTVTAEQETVFKKILQDREACGSVRAVRP